MENELIPLFGRNGEDNRFGFGIGLGGHAGLDPALRNKDHILGKTELFKNPDEPGGGVGLGPMHAVAGGTGEGVMVIVPTFTHGKQTEQPIVSAGIGSFKGAATKSVADRIDRPGDVLVYEKADETTPDETPKGTQKN